MPRPTNAELIEKAQLAEKGLKRCRNCREVLPLGSFGVKAKTADGLQPWCKPCTNARMSTYDKASRERDPELYAARKRAEHLRYKEKHPDRHRANIRKQNLRKYGLTPEAFDEMFSQQGGKCAICQIDLEPGRSTHIDHCHTSGAVRALLCGGCNVGLGAFRERPDVLREAAAYLDRFTEG